MSTHISKKEFMLLKESIDWSIRQLEYPKTDRVNAIKEYVGKHYNDGGSDKRMPTNFLYMSTGIYVRQLSPQAPRVMFTTKNRALKPYAKTAEIAVNQVPGEIDLSSTLSRWVLEALFSMGIAKVGLGSTGVSNDNNPVSVFVDIVTLDDYFLDMAAENYADIQYEVNDF